MASSTLRTTLRALSNTQLPVLRSAARTTLVPNTSRSFSTTQRIWEKRYTEDHEWIELSADKKTGTVGISTYAAKALGDVVYVELPEVDAEVSSGDTIGAVESVKSASDIMIPIAGKILEVNKVLEDTPAKINQSPEADGWIAKVEVSDPAEVEALMDAAAYKSFTEEAEEQH